MYYAYYYYAVTAGGTVSVDRGWTVFFCRNRTMEERLWRRRARQESHNQACGKAI